MRDKIGVVQSKTSLLNLIGYIGQLDNDHYYNIIMQHVDYQFGRMESPITMFENNHLILIEGPKTNNGIHYYIRFVKGENNSWQLAIGERQNNTDQNSDQAFVYFIEDGLLRRDTVQKVTNKSTRKTIKQVTACALNDNTFEVIHINDHSELVRMR